MQLAQMRARTASRASVMAALASPYLMVAVFLLTGGGALAVAHGWAEASKVMPVPFILLAVNLVAAISTRPRFRADVPLLVFHIALLALVVLFGAARLTYFDGLVPLTSGMRFDGGMVVQERGPWHPDRLGALRFANEGFTENYPKRGEYVATYNRVRWWDEQEQSHEADIGDDRPLLLAGYRIYPTRERGFSPVFHWAPREGEDDLGTVQLSDSSRDIFAPSNEWELAGGPAVWVMLTLDDDVLPAPGTRRANLGANALPHTLVVRVNEQRHELRIGERLELPEGVLTYVRLDSWMGYRITYDPTKPWVIATVLVAMASLLWFYARRFRARGFGSE